MAFADHALEKPSTGGRPSLITQHLAKMPPGEATAARNLLASDCTNEYVAKVFSAEGYPCSAAAIRKWRIVNGGGIYEGPST